MGVRYSRRPPSPRSKRRPSRNRRPVPRRYGGHITDFWDRKTNNTYLEVSFHDGLLKQAELGHGFNSPDPQTCTTAAGYLKHLDTLPAESPLIYGLHMNSEIAYLNNATSSLLSTILRLKAGGGGGGGSGSDGDAAADAYVRAGGLPLLLDVLGRRATVSPTARTSSTPFFTRVASNRAP